MKGRIRKRFVFILLFALFFSCALTLFLRFGAAYAEGNELRAATVRGAPVAEEPPVSEEPVENAWIKEPSVIRWTYSDFNKNTNLICAEPEKGEVKFSILSADGEEISPALSGFSVNGGGIVSDELEEELKKLPVRPDGYILRAEVAGTEEYGSLSADCGFEVVKAENRWLVKPQVLGWRHGEYNPELNFISAIPAYGGNSVTFFLYERKNGGIFNLKHFTDDGGNLVVPFGFNQYGGFPDYIVRGLRALDAGTYSLLAIVLPTENYTGLNLGASSASNGGAIFEVKPTENYWLTSPSIVPWSWGRFDRAVNLLNAVPAYPLDASDKEVKFGIYASPECEETDAVEGLEEFYSSSGTADGEEVESSAVDKLRVLDAGTYYLKAEVKSCGNFSSLKTVAPFTVLKNRNYWASPPAVKEWRYGEYDPAVNIISAIPAYPARDAEVRFKIYLSDGATPAFEQPAEGFETDRATDKLASIPAGEYRLEAVSAGGGNFNGLVGISAFRVHSFENFWVKTPSVTDFEYGSFERAVNKITATPAVGEVRLSIYCENGEIVSFGEDGATVFGFDENGLIPEYVAAKLKFLSEGGYYLHAYVMSNDGNYTSLNDYSDLEDIKRNSVIFNISKARNVWITAPKAVGWAEGKYNGENCFSAEAKLASDKLKIYVLDGEGRILTSCAGGHSFDENVLKNLPAGDYVVRFEIDETENYYKLSEDVDLKVFEEGIEEGYVIAATAVALVFAVLCSVGLAVTVLRRKKQLKK